jgi:ferric-dicitrate binding protein FerR (iron transport regulator)
MLELEQLIEKFWAHQSTPEENKRLFDLLNTQKDNYRQALEPHFKVGVFDQHLLPPEKASDLLGRIHVRLAMEVPAGKRTDRSLTVRKLVFGSAVAASICILVASLFLLTGKRGSNRLESARNRPLETPRLMHLTNNSDTLMPVVLDDGSTAQLGKHSSLAWYRPFADDRRDLSLEGTGFFKVTKDTKRPFTVYAAGTATTALGTRFWVGTEEGRKVMVRLLEGKVVVNAAAGSGMVMKGVYLTPGQQFSLDKQKLQYTVKAIPGKQDQGGPVAAPPGNPELVFNKAPLGSVFRKIGRAYHVPIRFNRADMDSLYFTGTFLKTDNLNGILSTICNVNDLLLIKDQDSIIIKKSQ